MGGAYIPCRNIALRDDEFLISPEDWADAEDRGTIEAVVHSHPGQDPPVMGADDLAAQARMKIPWVLLGARVSPVGLVGREFAWGTADCYTLVRDWYRITYGVVLPDWPHEPLFWERGESPFLDHYAEAGFWPVQIQDIVPGDVVLMKVASDVPNHCAVYLGGGHILHHLMHRRSCVEPLSPWLRRLVGVYRRAKI